MVCSHGTKKRTGGTTSRTPLHPMGKKMGALDLEIHFPVQGC